MNIFFCQLQISPSKNHPTKNINVKGPFYNQPSTAVPSDTNTPGGAAQRNFSRNGRSEVPVAKRRRLKKPQAMIVSMADTVFFIP